MSKSNKKGKETPKEKLYKAIREGNMQQVLEWVGQVNKNKKYPLHWGDESMKKFRNRWWNWLHYSVFFNQLEIVKHLVEVVQIDANIQTILIVSRSKYYWDDTALHIAAREGHFEILEYLLTKEIKKDIKNYGGKKATEVTEDEKVIDLILHGIKPKHDEEDRVVEESEDMTMQPVSGSVDTKDDLLPPRKEEKVTSSSSVGTKEVKILTENIQRLKRKVEDLEESLDKQKEELDDKQSRITELLDSVNKEQKKCREQAVEIEQLKKENEHLIGDAMKHGSSEDTIRGLKQKLKDTKETNKNLETLISSTKRKLKDKDAEMKDRLEEKEAEIEKIMEDTQKNVATSGWEGMRKFFEENLKVSGLSTKIKKIVEIHQTLNELSTGPTQPSETIDEMSKFEVVLKEFQSFGKDVGQGVTRLRETMKNEGFLEVKKFFRSFLQGEEQFIQFLETSTKTYERYYQENCKRHERSKTVEDIFRNYRRDFRALKKLQKVTRQLQLELDLLEDEEGSDVDDDDLESTDEEGTGGGGAPKKKDDDGKVEEMRRKVREKEQEMFSLKRRLESRQAEITNMDCFPLYKRIYLSKMYSLNFKKEQAFVDSFSGKGVLMLDRDLSDYNDIKLIYSNLENRIYRGSLRGEKKKKKKEQASNKEVVIKVLPYDRRSERLVQNEVHNLLNLRHPNIISIHCIFPFKEYKKKFLGVEMESVTQDLLHWVKGVPPKRKYDDDEDMEGGGETPEEDLNKLISFRNKQNPSVIKDVLFQIASGLSFIHEKGIIHRDLKPQNLLVMEKKEKSSRHDSDNIVKIIDFGISKNENSNFFTTMGVHMLATERYKPCHDVQIVKKSDVFSLGIIYYEILAMNYMDDGYTLKGCEEFGDLPEENLEDCFSKDERDLLTKMLQKNPQERISSDDILDHKYFEECLNRLKKRKKRMQSEDDDDDDAPPIEDEERYNSEEEEEDLLFKKE